MIIVDNTELQHHGILGQKWGVRRFQNPDGSYTKAGIDRYYGRHKIKKGSSLYRISGNEMLTPGRGVYVVRTDNDRSQIKNGLSKKLASYHDASQDDMYEYELSTTKEIKVASINDVRDAQQSLIKTHPEFSTGAATNIVNQNIPVNFKKLPPISDQDTIETYKKKVKDTIPKEEATQYAKVIDNLFNGRNEFLTAIAIVGNTGVYSNSPVVKYYQKMGMDALDMYVGADSKYQKALIEELSSKGFDGMYDTNLTNGSGVGLEESLLIFDSDSVSVKAKSRL